MKDNQFLQAVLPASKGGLSVFSALLLLLPAFLVSALGVKNTLGNFFCLEHMYGTYDDALKPWFQVGKIEMAPENGIKKKLDRDNFDFEIANLSLRLEPTNEKKFNAF